MSYRGLSNWPPIWTWRGGQENKRARGEVGVLRDVFYSRVEPRSRVYLIVEHDGEEYMGSLLFNDPAFCGQIFELLDKQRGSRVVEIGSLDVNHLF
ncbi:MAG TPA: hypothetical protein VGB09_04415 [Candidatus Binatia bacterium]